MASILNQALNFIKNIPQNVQESIKTNVTYPLARMSPEYQQNIKSGELYSQIKPIYDRMTAKDKINFNNPSKSDYVYQGKINPNRTVIRTVFAQPNNNVTPIRLSPTATPSPTIKLSPTTAPIAVKNKKIPLRSKTTPTDIPNLQPAEAAALLARVQELYRSRVPQGQRQEPLENYYPIAPYLQQIIETGEGLRPGAGVLAALQAFYESTGGRGGGNFWGILPGGEADPSSGQRVTSMPIEEQLNYLYGPSVLGGGANPNMNIINEGDASPLNVSRIRRLYDSYNPSGDYLSNILNDYAQIMSN